MRPKGELVSMGSLRGVTGMLCPRANLVEMYEQVAPESNKTEAIAPYTKNIPYTTSGASWASSTVMWLRRLQTVPATFLRGAAGVAAYLAWVRAGGVPFLMGHSAILCPGWPQPKQVKGALPVEVGVAVLHVPAS